MTIIDFNPDASTTDELLRDVNTLHHIQVYCVLQIAASEQRLTGQISAALTTERQMQRIYDSLPESARW